jgi:hypothetical protein
MGGILNGIFKCLVLLQFVVLGGATSGDGAGHLFSGRPGSQSVDDFEDRLLEAYAKAKLKEKRLTKAEFLLQLPAYLEHEALQLWRKNLREEILIEPDEREKLKTSDPIAAVIKLFQEHFGVASAAKVFELQTLRKRADKTCRIWNAQEQGGPISGGHRLAEWARAGDGLCEGAAASGAASAGGTHSVGQQPCRTLHAGVCF